jgi:hypothetical protein
MPATAQGPHQVHPGAKLAGFQVNRGSALRQHQGLCRQHGQLIAQTSLVTLLRQGMSALGTGQR